MTVDLAAIRAAAVSCAGMIRHTPIVSSATMSGNVGTAVEFKAENLQRTGAFKIRGAMNKLASLGEARSNGVTAGSAGNHALALAFAARHAGVSCDIFVPTGAPISKIAACESFGATVYEVGTTLLDAVTASRTHAELAGMAFCHPFDDEAVIAGQGTIGLELVDDVDDLRTVVVPLGGGGLSTGIAIAVKTLRPEVRVIGVQAAACAPYAGMTPKEGPVTTLADGIAVKSPGAITGPLVERWLDEVVIVDEDATAAAMVLLMERAKLVVEGAGAVGVAALMSGQIAQQERGTTCVVISGGNVDLGVIPGLIRRHENLAGRRLTVFVRLDDQPGSLAHLLEIFASEGANLIEVEHVREGLELHVRETGVRATFEVRGPKYAERAVETARSAGYVVTASWVSR